MWVAPSFAALSLASFLEFFIPADAARFPQPEEPWTSPRNLHVATICASASCTRAAAALGAVAQLDMATVNAATHAEEYSFIIRLPLGRTAIVWRWQQAFKAKHGKSWLRRTHGSFFP
jgi:hypothetical protein